MSFTERVGTIAGSVLRNTLFIVGWVVLVWVLSLQIGGGFFGLVLSAFAVTVWMLTAQQVVNRAVAYKK